MLVRFQIYVSVSVFPFRLWCLFSRSSSCTVQCFILGHRQLCGECQITAAYMIHTHDVTEATPALHLSLLLLLPSARNCYINTQPVSQSARCISSSCVLETGTGCLCRAAGWLRPWSYTTEALFRPESAALRAAATEEAVAQSNTHSTRDPQNKTSCEMLTPLCFPHSSGSVWVSF